MALAEAGHIIGRMKLRRSDLFLVAVATVASHSAVAHAEGVIFPGTRPLGTGGAMRGLATGDAGPQLNPSGISLMRTYQLEGAYQYGSTGDSNDARVSAVDSTSGLNLGGALNYTYHHESAGDIRRSGHIIGVSLSFPFADKVFVGGTVKYVHFTDSADTTRSGFTYDAGITLHPVPQLSLGAAGYNLSDFGDKFLPRGVGGGVALLPIPNLLLAFDAVYEGVYGDPTRSTTTHYMGGAEFSFSSVAAIRAGGGWNGLTKNGYLSGGLSVLSADVGAIDFGLHQDISGNQQSTIVGVSARLFVPNM